MTTYRKFKHPYRRPEHLQDLYFFIKDYQKEHKRPPTQGVIAEKYGTYRSVVRYWLQRMEEARMIERTPHVALGIHLLPYSFSKGEPHADVNH